MILAYSGLDPVAAAAESSWKSDWARLWVRDEGRIERVLEDLRRVVEDRGGAWDEVEERLERDGLVRRGADGPVATGLGRRIARDGILELVFGGMPRPVPGGRAAPRVGGRGPRERIPSTRPWAAGDDPREIDWGTSLRNARRRGAGPGLLEERDLEAWESESASGCASVLLIDVSHSMVLYGEDRITPAKMVAIALAEHIRRHHPRDSLDVVAFGNEARTISVDSIAGLSAGPFDTNTADGLRLARDLLRRRRASSKRILMITDGKPSCAFDRGRLRRNSGDLDPRVVELTLAEGRRAAREGCEISTFMVARDPRLVEFVERFTRAVRGQAFSTGVDRLGEFVLREWGARRGASRG